MVAVACRLEVRVGLGCTFLEIGSRNHLVIQKNLAHNLDEVLGRLVAGHEECDHLQKPTALIRCNTSYLILIHVFGEDINSIRCKHFFNTLQIHNSNLY